MPATDPIADALTKIRNASRATHPSVDVRVSRVVRALLQTLQQEGYVRAVKPVGTALTQQRLRVYLKYQGRRPAIVGLVRVSRPGMRQYRRARALPRVLRGLGVAVITTSKGVMTDRDAYRQRIGGEVLCYVW